MNFKYKTKLEQISVLLPLLFYVFAGYVGDKLYKSWQKELLTAEMNDVQPSLLKTVARVFGWRIVLQGFMLAVLEFGCRCSQPFFLGGLVSFYSQTGDSLNDKSEAYWYTAGIILTNVINVLFSHS